MQDETYIGALKEMIESSELTDLSHTLEPSMPAWPTQARFGSVVYDSYDYGGVALHSMITMSEHTGTHIDAPKHFIRGGRPVDRLALKTLMGRGVHIDALGLGEGELLPVQAVHAFEKENGGIRKGDIVMFRFGWDAKYGLQPAAAEYLHGWPGLSEAAAVYLAGKEVAAVGSDTLAIDADGNGDNPAHYALLGKDIPVIENIANLEKLPAFFFVIGLPLKFKEGSGSPIRLTALVKKTHSA